MRDNYRKPAIWIRSKVNNHNIKKEFLEISKKKKNITKHVP